MTQHFGERRAEFARRRHDLRLAYRVHEGAGEAREIRGVGRHP